MDGFLRARQPRQKEERRAVLLEAARSLLLRTRNAHALTLSELAREAGMAKSNVYRYFETREAALLALMESEWGAWFDRRDRRWWTPPPTTVDLESLVDELAHSLSEAPLLCHLTSVLASILEFHLSEETLLRFKQSSLAFFTQAAHRFHAVCPTLPQEQWFGLLHDAVPVIAGLHPLSHPSPTVERILQAPHLASFRHHFPTDLRRHLLALARFRT